VDPGLEQYDLALKNNLSIRATRQAPPVKSTAAQRAFTRLAGYNLLWLAPLVFLGLFYFYPLASILGLSLTWNGANPAAALWGAISSPLVGKVLSFTVWQAVVSTLLTLLFGLPGAYLIAHYDFRGKPLLQALTSIPFVMPTLVVAAAFNALLGPHGWANLALMALLHLAEPPLSFTNSLGAILIAHVFYNSTIVLRMVGDFWSHLDPRLEQAAQVLGASRMKTLVHVTLPLLAPALLAAALLVFIFDFSSFGVILVLGGPRFTTLEVEIYNQTINVFNLPMAATLSIIQLACTLGMTVVYTRLVNRLSRPLNLRPQKITQRRLSTWRSRLFAGIVITLLLGLLILPLASLALSSITTLETKKTGQGIASAGFTLDYYKELNINRRNSFFYRSPGTAIGISLTYAAITIALSLLLGIPASWALAHNSQSFASRLFDPLIMLPLGTSAVTLGLGFLIALDKPPLDLRASPALVPLAHTLVAFPFVVRSLAPAFRSIQPRLRQAAAVMGASPQQVLRTIDLPMAGRAILVAATFAFTISMGEFGATSLIVRPEYPTIPVAIYRFISQPGALNYGQALALSTILMLVCAAGMLAIERFRIADVGEF
jgi:thiamine transport system permease protein